MDTFFNLLRKTIVGTVFFMFGIVAVYVPQDWNKIDEAHAFIGGASEFTQILNKIQLAAVNAATSLSATLDKVTSFGVNSLFTKEFTLDGIAWAIAKGVVSSMVQSLISWINSGFEGSPMFVQDLSGFLRNAADEAIGTYLDDLGGLGSFICSPFRLDVQIAVAIEYERTRIGQPAPTCTLTGVFDNFEGFIGGERGSFSQGGWNDWIDISSSPEMYTPFGQVLAGQAGARTAILNAEGEEFAYLNFGDGFLSGKICDDTPDSDRENCWISKPGKVIEESLSSNLDSGREALITADEIDEILSSLLGQLAQTALTGSAGLLGLSSGNPHTYTGFTADSYVRQMEVDARSGSGVINNDNAINLMLDTREQQESIEGLATSWKSSFQTKYNSYQTIIENLDFYDSNYYDYYDDYDSSSSDIDIYNEYTQHLSTVEEYINATQYYISRAQSSISTLDRWIVEYPTASIERKMDILNDYRGEIFYSEVDSIIKQREWQEGYNALP